jgi:hypothetical protein
MNKGPNFPGLVLTPFFFASCSFDDSHSYINPFIKEKIAYLWDHTFKQNKQAQYHSGKLLILYSNNYLVAIYIVGTFNFLNEILLMF